MAKEARELEAFLQGIAEAEDLAIQAGNLVANLETRGILTIKRAPRVDLPAGLEGIRRETIMIGGKTRKQLKCEFKTPPFQLSEYAEDLIDRAGEFATPSEEEPMELIFPRVREMGLTGTPITDQVYQRGLDLGWSLCPAKVGPHLRLQDREQPLGSVYWIAMEPIADRDGYPSVFGLAHNQNGLWLYGSWTEPTRVWDPGHQLVFRLSK